MLLLRSGRDHAGVTPTLGRFAQADSVVPGGAQGLDRYAYAANNPLRYTDPSGHNPKCGPDGIYCDDNVPAEEKYQISFLVADGFAWSDQDKVAVIAAVEAVANKFAAILGVNAGRAWELTFGHMTFQMGGCDQCAADGDVAGFTYGAHEIRFRGLSQLSDLRRKNHVVHELGHAFKWDLYNKTGIEVYSELGKWRNTHPGYPDRPTWKGPGVGKTYGFASPQNVFTWQQSLDGSDAEEFADQFLGWVFNMWERDKSGHLASDGQARSSMMKTNMLLWVNKAAGR